MNSSVRFRLSVMMFLQYATWGAWAVSLGGYMGKTLGFTGVQIGAIYGTTAIAAMISPLFIGYIADRFFATEHVIGVLHLIGAILLGSAAFSTEFSQLYPIMIVYALCYMPTLALTNSISFANIGDPEREFPGIRVWGTWGWIVAGWLVGFVLDAKNPGSSNGPILLAAICSATLGLFSFVLPHTPPRSAEGVVDTDTSKAGLQSLLLDPSFLVFVICSFLVCIPLSFYYGFANLFLTEIDAPLPTALQTIGQLSEVGFMAAMPFFITRLGVKRMLAVGMLAWVIRYFCFGTLSMPFVVFGLILHGICYDFFFVASQIYVDTRTSVAQRARAQSFIAFVTLGLGMFIGAYVGGIIVDRYQAVTIRAVVVSADGKEEEKVVPLPTWDSKGELGIAKALSLKPGDTLDQARISESILVTNLDSGVTHRFSKTDLVEILTQVDKDGDTKVTIAEWEAAQDHNWPMIWFWPALAAGITLVIFWIGFHDNRRGSAPVPVG
jgi:nucleoside transporter